MFLLDTGEVFIGIVGTVDPPKGRESGGNVAAGNGMEDETVFGTVLDVMVVEVDLVGAQILELKVG